MFMLSSMISLGFPGGLDGKESACNARDLGSIPRSGRSSGEGRGYPLQYSRLENPMDRGAWWATVPGVMKSRTHTLHHFQRYVPAPHHCQPSAFPKLHATPGWGGTPGSMWTAGIAVSSWDHSTRGILSASQQEPRLLCAPQSWSGSLGDGARPGPVLAGRQCIRCGEAGALRISGPGVREWEGVEPGSLHF